MAYLENQHIEIQIVNFQKRRLCGSSPRYKAKTDDPDHPFFFVNCCMYRQGQWILFKLPPTEDSNLMVPLTKP